MDFSEEMLHDFLDSMYINLYVKRMNNRALFIFKYWLTKFSSKHEKIIRRVTEEFVVSSSGSPSKFVEILG